MSGSKLLHLQGLRGLAIIAIICFHFLPTYFPNGYFGVDLFFVLSGYLMGKMMSKYSKATWSIFLDFWYRRARRILPLYYLMIGLTIVTLFIFAVPNLPWVIDSATNAILLKTNLVSYSGYDYFVKLNSFFDLFTHTWSLCVELQFYLIFPFIWYLNTLIPGKYTYFCIPWVLACGSSVIFYFNSDEFTAFNCTLARVWQFGIGVIVQKNSEDRKKDDLAWISSLMGLTVLCVTIFSQFAISAHHMRLVITACSTLPIVFGNGCILLENRVLVFIGEISYAWYLVHWPIVTYQRQFDLFEIHYFIIFITASFVISVFLHFAFERFYLKWDSYMIIIVVCLFVFSSAVLLQPLMGITPREVLRLQKLAKNYTNLTKEEVINYNRDLFFNDAPLLSLADCLEKEHTSFSKDWQNYCELTANLKPFSRKKVMMVGNSWAANALTVYHQECRPFFANLSIYTVGGCDVLPTNKRSCKVKAEFVKYIEKFRPDVLFIVVRHIDMLYVDEGMLPLDDGVFGSALTKLRLLESLVSEKIYLLDAFPAVNIRITKIVNDAIKRGDSLTTKDVFDPPNGFKVARMRIKELAAQCSKCEVFDYVPYFARKDRSLGLYDEDNYVTYFNSQLHLTLPGLEKVRPLYRQLCEKAANA